MILVTGGAGFIGSNVVAALNENGCTDVIINDSLGTDDKWLNLRKRQFADLVHPSDLADWIVGRKLDAIIHLGAISDTTATDGDLVLGNNFRTSLKLLDWCTNTQTPFIYASSAATYGDGTAGFIDDWSASYLRGLRPLNLYGWSKHLFDLAVVERYEKRQKLPPQWAGVKFFNVFGPNEYHKGAMMSVVAKLFDSAKSGHTVQLFKSHKEDVDDGGQMRDFIYVDDAVRVLVWLLKTPSVCGIFNVGTGRARCFRDLALALFGAVGRQENIEYVDMPEQLRSHYQYFTQASTASLRRAGFNAAFVSLEEAVQHYVTGFLNAADRYR